MLILLFIAASLVFILGIVFLFGRNLVKKIEKLMNKFISIDQKFPLGDRLIGIILLIVAAFIFYQAMSSIK